MGHKKKQRKKEKKGKGAHSSLTSSREACEAALYTQRPTVITKDGLKLKLTNQKQFMAGSPAPVFFPNNSQALP